MSKHCKTKTRRTKVRGKNKMNAGVVIAIIASTLIFGPMTTLGLVFVGVLITMCVSLIR